MTSINPEMIRDISVKAVEDFLNNKIPLSQGLAKQAAAFDLNSEQIKRAVESTNNIAYLKILQLSDDRTIEFPLAKYAEVMEKATVPDNLQEKIASATAQNDSSMEKVAYVASAGLVTEKPPEYKMAKNEALTYFIKAAAANKQALENIEGQSQVLTSELVKSGKALKQDAAWMDKLACVTNEEEFSQLSYLVSGDVQTYRNRKDLGLFKEAQLNESAKFVGLFKQAQALVREHRSRMELQKRADDTTKTMRQTFVNGTQKAMEAPGHVIGKAVGTVASIPFHAASSAASAVKNSLKSNFSKAVSEGSGKVGGAAKAIGTTSGAVGKGLLGAANPVFDAALYNPGVDETTGKSNDAWTALQRE